MNIASWIFIASAISACAFLIADINKHRKAVKFYKERIEKYGRE